MDKINEGIHKDFQIELENTKQVMQALLAGKRIAGTSYCNGWGNDISMEPDHYLYLSESGYICEEDGAQAKSDRVAPINMRNDERWWIIN